jgi:hypothetical protein
MAFTTAQLTALEQAIGMGQLVVEYDGKKVQYRDMGDLMKAYNFVQSQLIASGAITATPSVLSNRGPGALTIFSRD